MSAVIEFHFEETHEYNHISEKYENINKNLDLELPNKYLIKINLEKKLIEENKLSGNNFKNPHLKISKRIFEDGTLHDFFGYRNSPKNLIRYSVRELQNQKTKKAKDFIKFEGKKIIWGWGWEDNLFQEKKFINIKTGILENEISFKGRKFKAKHNFLSKENYKLLKNFKYGDKLIFLTNYEWNHLKRKRTI